MRISESPRFIPYQFVTKAGKAYYYVLVVTSGYLTAIFTMAAVSPSTTFSIALCGTLRDKGFKKMSARYVAHRRADGEEQSLECHLADVGSLSAKSAAKIVLPTEGNAQQADLGCVGELLGLIHDLGKYSKTFQDYLKSATGMIDQDADDYVDAEKLRGRIVEPEISPTRDGEVKVRVTGSDVQYCQ
jgi:hypothetical protein